MNLLEYLLILENFITGLQQCLNDKSNCWNIFQWNINDDEAVVFDYQEWRKIPENTRKQMDINSILKNYHHKHATIKIKIF